MTPRKINPATIGAGAITAARIAGCTCDPDIDLTEEFPGFFHADVLHDDWCPLLQRRSARWS